MDAYIWFSLAIADGHHEDVENRKIVESEMTQNQILDAKKRVESWLSFYAQIEHDSSLFASFKSMFN